MKILRYVLLLAAFALVFGTVYFLDKQPVNTETAVTIPEMHTDPSTPTTDNTEAPVDNWLPVSGYNFSSHIIKGIAHRGLSAEAPENTIAAFKLAKQRGFSFVEADTAVTSDGTIVILHDNTVDRTSNGTGNIADMTLEEVQTLDFGSWKSEAYAGEQILTFEEFILYCRNAQLYPYIEIKSSAVYTDENLQNMAETVNRLGMARSCTWISFSEKYLAKIADLDSAARIGWILDSSETESLATGTYVSVAADLRTGLNEVFILAKSATLTDDGIAVCQKAGIPIEVWTIGSIDFPALDSYISGAMSNDANYEDYLLEISKT